MKITAVRAITSLTMQLYTKQSTKNMHTPGEFKGSRRGGTDTVVLPLRIENENIKQVTNEWVNLKHVSPDNSCHLHAVSLDRLGQELYTKSLMTPGSCNPIFFKIFRLRLISRDAGSATKLNKASMRKNQPTFRTNAVRSQSKQVQTSQVLREETHLFTNHKPTCL